MTNPKFEFVSGDTKTVNGRLLTRIRALAAIAAFDVTSGDLGGYLEAEANLSVSDNARVSGDAWVSDNARVSGDAWVSDNASKTPLQIGGLAWQVTILDAHMQIGCHFHRLADWASFDNAAIAAMHDDALPFWAAHKALILGLAAANGRA